MIKLKYKTNINNHSSLEFQGPTMVKQATGYLSLTKNMTLVL